MDYSATTPCDERVVQEMIPYFTTSFGNASSRTHQWGWQAAAAVEQARERVAALLNAQAREIIFTSGATEACNLALRGIFERYAVKGRHLITAATEHKAVLDTCKALEKKGATVTFLEVNKAGLVDPQALEKAITPSTILVSVMLANNETGVIQPIQQIGAVCKKQKVLFFCDATHAIGKIPVDVDRLQVDLMAFSAHKIYGPKGVGALYVRSRHPRVTLTAQITGGGQELDTRSGTLNVPGIVGLGKACDLCQEELEDSAKRMACFRKQLKTGLLALPGAVMNGAPQHSLPHVLNISFSGLNSSQLLSALGSRLAISSGSACTSGSLDPSYVLAAMGLDPSISRSALRFSMGRFTTAADIPEAIQAVAAVAATLRSQQPV